MNHFPVLLLRNLHAPCASQARACVLCAKLLQCCCPRTWPARDPGRMQTLSSRLHIAPKLRKSADKSLSQPWCSHSNTIYDLQLQKTIEKICWQITFAALMQPFQYDLRSSAAKDNSITHAAAAPSNLDAATTMRSAETELQNTIELRAMASEIAAPKPDLDAKATKRRFWSTF